MRRAERLPLHLLQDRVARIAGRRVREQHLGVGGEAGDRRVDLVRDAGGEHAERGEPLALGERPLGADAVGHVVDEDDAAVRARRGTPRPRRAGRAPRLAGVESRASKRRSSAPGAGGAELDAGQHLREAQAHERGLRAADQRGEGGVGGVDRGPRASSTTMPEEEERMTLSWYCCSVRISSSRSASAP